MLTRNVPALSRLLNELTKLPGLGPKSAERLSHHILKASLSEVTALAEALVEAKKKIQLCRDCHNYTEKELCWICEKPQRRNGQICVVEDPLALDKIEKTGVFQGSYHVLHGSINLLAKVTPEQLYIPSLIRRVEEGVKSDQLAIKEVILAMDSDLEGDTTALYLQEALAHLPVKISRLARGIPIGMGMSYLDEQTLSLAMENRIYLEPKSGVS